MKVKLDEVGSFAWRRLDGQTRFEDVARSLRDSFGEKVEPAEERLKTFMTILYRDKFVKLEAPVEDCSIAK
jgi:hypothetical protein